MLLKVNTGPRPYIRDFALRDGDVRCAHNLLPPPPPPPQKKYPGSAPATDYHNASVVLTSHLYFTLYLISINMFNNYYVQLALTDIRHLTFRK